MDEKIRKKINRTAAMAPRILVKKITILTGQRVPKPEHKQSVQA